MTPLRIAMVCSAKGWAGGEVYVASLAGAMQARGRQVTVFCRAGSRMEAALADRGIDHRAIAPRNSADLVSVVRMALALRRGRYHVVHGHVGKDYVPTVVAGWLARKPAILTRHLLLPMKPVSRWFMLRAARVIAVSSAVRDVLINQNELPPALVSTVLSGVDLDRFRPGQGSGSFRAELGIAPDQLLLGAIGQLHTGKRIDVLLKAISIVNKTHPEVAYVLVGEGPELPAVEQFRRDLGLEQNLTLAGYRADIDAILPELDGLLLATDGEPFGLVVAEAMACGIPVVAARAGGPAEIVADGKTGLLFETGDPEAMADAMRELVGNPDRARSMGAAGRVRAEEMLDETRMMNEMETLYREVSGPTGRANPGRPH